MQRGFLNVSRRFWESRSEACRAVRIGLIGELCVLCLGRVLIAYLAARAGAETAYGNGVR